MAAIEIHIVCSLCCFDQTGHSDGTKERNEKSNSAFKRWRQRGRDYFSSVKKRGGTPTRTHGDGKAREESRKWRRRKKKERGEPLTGQAFQNWPIFCSFDDDSVHTAHKRSIPGLSVAIFYPCIPQRNASGTYRMNEPVSFSRYKHQVPN